MEFVVYISTNLWIQIQIQIVRFLMAQARPLNQADS
jgi:hypothetical protein